MSAVPCPILPRLPPTAPHPDWRAPEGELPPVGKQPEHPRTWLVLSDQHAYIDKVLDEVRPAVCWPQIWSVACDKSVYAVVERLVCS